MKTKKEKGLIHEWKICKSLSLWYTKGKRDDIFYPTSSSGARATKRMKDNISTANSCGDVGALDHIGFSIIEQYIFELKSGYSKGPPSQQIQIVELLDNRNKKLPILIQWIKKLKKEAKKHNRKHPVLIFRRDRKDSCIVFFDYTWEMIRSNNQREFTMNDGPSVMIGYKKYNLFVLRLLDFFYWCEPQALIKKVKRIKRRKYKLGKYSGKNMINYPDPL